MKQATDRNPSAPRRPADEPPPFLGRWKRIYLLVLLYLFTLIVVLYAVTRIFHY